MNKKQAHLEMIQGVINRLSTNSFSLKGWTVALVSALFVLAGQNQNVYFAILAYFPAISLWVLDAYFLWQERLFRGLFDHVRGLKEDEIDFSMNTSIIKDQISPWYAVILSKTLLIFHGVILGSIIVVMFFLI